MVSENDLVRCCQKNNDFVISESHLADVIRDNNITRKRTRQRHYPVLRYGKPIDFKKEMEIFYKTIDQYSLSKIICIDETSINAQMVHSYSRCSLGKRCVHKTINNKVFQKFTLRVCAISSKGLVGWTLYQKGGMTGDRMCEFIKSFITNKFKKCLIIMDNGGPHKSKSIDDLITRSKNKLQFSVPYRPKTNAIESYFNQFKHYYKLDSDSILFDELKKNIQLCIKQISSKIVKTIWNMLIK